MIGLELNPGGAVNAINKLSNKDRVILRQALIELKLPTPRNLYFNYETQTWID